MILRIITVLQRFRAVWLNLLFAAYLVFLEPPVYERLSAAIERGWPDLFMGSLLIFIQLLEVAGMLMKRPVSAYFARVYPPNPAAGSGRENGRVILTIFALIFHLAGSAFLTLVALDVMSAGNGMGDTGGAWGLLLFFVVLVKEAFVVSMLLGMGGGAAMYKEPGQKPKNWVERLSSWLVAKQLDTIRLKDALLDLGGDLLLLVFSTLAFTALWGVVSGSSPLHGQGLERLPEYLGISFLFLGAYFTTRSVYLMEGLSVMQSRLIRIVGWASFFLVWLGALWALP